MAITLEWDICRNTRAYGRTLVYGRMLWDGGPLWSQEVWLEVNGKYAVQDYTDSEGSFRFTLFLVPGVYRLRIVGYRVPDRRDGRIVQVMYTSESKQLVIRRPSILSRMIDVNRYCSRFCMIDRSEVEPLKDTIRRVLEKHGIRKAYLTGGIVSRGWSCHDVDVYTVPAVTDPEEKALIQKDLMDATCMFIDLVPEPKGPLVGL